ncbi:hypothetical protein GCM10009848_36220 [Micromonospora lupini]|uniref:Uncharacterized protein n=1 Tax=Micromonospora lupini str. Lupac 08 TaxID=1150864 RepID=I0L2C8_9ACTN|nr:hypothetical protein MILUP08_42906 [Micromonospora lupini str. Lupac 08]
MSLSLLSLLTGCTPPDEPLVALAVHDGQPIGVLVTCGESSARLDVYEIHPGDVTERPLVMWAVSGRPTSETVEVALLGQPPDGWKIDDATDFFAAGLGRVVDVEPLTELRPGVTYSIKGSGRHDAISVDFTLADLPRIGSDQVLAPRGQDSTKIVSRKTFLRRARSSC